MGDLDKSGPEWKMQEAVIGDLVATLTGEVANLDSRVVKIAVMSSAVVGGLSSSSHMDPASKSEWDTVMANLRVVESVTMARTTAVPGMSLEGKLYSLMAVVSAMIILAVAALSHTIRRESVVVGIARRFHRTIVKKRTGRPN